ncbi:STN domain-containing protein [Acidovorax sp. Root217]|uniref:STN domain-containing protein n=1 Tax=Acidovorax sp. Root217 TaxID=1736492 RepID=UPI00070A41F5|nr:STN domain-containing protein [Acidovorax sp. Root217]KRC29477.1 hypothetical protein ASE31_12295 [Acidovorax sp. Root217]
MPSPSFSPRLLVAALTAAFCGASFAQTLHAPGDTLVAQAGAVQNWNLPAGPLDDTLARMARQGAKILTADPALLRGKTAPAVRGSFAVEEAVQRALAGSGLALVRLGNDTLTVRPAAPTPTAAPAAAPVAASGTAERSLAAVTVEGSRDPNQLYQPFAGGQVAKGARLGALGNTALLDAPFAISGYTE